MPFRNGAQSCLQAILARITHKKRCTRSYQTMYIFLSKEESQRVPCNLLKHRKPICTGFFLCACLGSRLLILHYTKRHKK